MLDSKLFFRPWLKPNRLSYRIYNQLAISNGLLDNSGIDEEIRRAGAFYRNNPFIFDMFGRIDSGGIFKFPSFIDRDFLELCLERVSDFKNPIVAWSGGVDSTFILACFVFCDIPVKVASVTTRIQNGEAKSIYFNKKLRDFVYSNFEHIEIEEPTMYINGSNGLRYLDYKVSDSTDIPLITGAWADALFFPNQRLKGDMHWYFEYDENNQSNRVVIYKDNYKQTLREFLESCYEDNKKVFTEREINILCEYGNAFGKPLEDRISIARFLYFISVMPSFLFDSTLMYMPKLESFFCTQKFIDLAYSEYWMEPNTSSIYPRNKAMELDFIRAVFGMDFNVKSNW